MKLPPIDLNFETWEEVGNFLIMTILSIAVFFITIAAGLVVVALVGMVF